MHCVIVGFGRTAPAQVRLFEYDQVDGNPHEVAAEQINPYLIDAPLILVPSREAPISKVPPMLYGNKPADGGFLLLSDEEKHELGEREPGAKKYLRPFISAKEFLHGEKRWCLWLVDFEPQDLKKLPLIRQRIEEVRKFRGASKKGATVELAASPTLFAEIRQPMNDYLLVPCHSSELRDYIPIGFFSAKNIVANSCMCVPNATRYEFGVMTSAMHMAWVRQVCGRLESRYRYSAQIVYNNYPWPIALTATQKRKIEHATQAVLDARDAHPQATLAELYDANAMPKDLRDAHKALDKAVDAAYSADGGKKSWGNDAERVAFLFKRYQAIAGGLAAG